MYDVFEKYGLTFIRVNESHIEMVRTWRNSDFVRSHMLYQEYITPEMQQTWFLTINNDKNFYYIVQQNGENVGLVNIKNVENKQGEPGFFLAYEKYKNTSITALVNFAFGEGFLGDILGLEKQYIRIRKDNEDALKMNLACGFHVVEEKSGEDYHYLELDMRNIYGNKKINKLRDYLIKKAQHDTK